VARAQRINARETSLGTGESLRKVSSSSRNRDEKMTEDPRKDEKTQNKKENTLSS